MYTDGLGTTQVEHVASSDQLLGSRTVEDGLRVDTGTHLEGDTGREVGLDITCDDGRRRTLGGNDHVDTYGTRQLGDTGDRQFNLLTGSHDQIAELIDDHYDIRHKAVSHTGRGGVLRNDLTLQELLVILLDIACADFFQQVITLVHQLTEGVQRAHHLRHIGDDGIGIVVGHLRQEVVDERVVDRELHLLRVYKYDLQFSRMFLV